VSSVRINDGYRLDWHFGGVSVLQDDIGVRVDEVSAVSAPEQCSCVHHVWVREGVPGIELFLQLALTPGALEGTVETVETFCFGSKYVFLPLDGSPY